eukprot:1276532-Pleurochrysis_carterae.AAC.1
MNDLKPWKSSSDVCDYNGRLRTFLQYSGQEITETSTMLLCEAWGAPFKAHQSDLLRLPWRLKALSVARMVASNAPKDYLNIL